MNRGYFFKENLEKIKKETIGKTILIAVSKTFPAEDIRLCYELGQRHFGENRVSELEQKAQELSDLKDIHWHFVGHLQSNKIKKLLSIKNLYAIHSVDKLSLLQNLIQEKNTAKLFLEVNTSGEKEKQGFSEITEIKEALKLASIEGLMTMAKWRTQDYLQTAQECFQKLKDIRDLLNKELKLSMGMSEDYPLAVKMGSDYIRVGQKIFGTRGNL